MARRDRHTRIVGWLKIGLPLAALAILSTLFLLSRRIEPADDLPFAQVELEDRARRQQITRPSLSGATDKGDLVEVSAAEVRPDTADPGRVTAMDVAARIGFADGGSMQVRADSAQFDQGAGQADLSGDVLVATGTGQKIRTGRLSIALDTLEVVAPGEVRSTGPEGTLTAGGMRVTGGAGGDDVQLVFTDGVKLVYEPQRSED
ncbi:LPS export ABC transporter periplasmic protein LptC [Pseudooceanicola nanhaiensis]|uniref:LPS export ABC transporter periplasmic protein LptC n=1 Tax=Pseudooceanicola nanhaiensis TaxID=375761 RepID=UPI0035167E2B